MELLILRPRLLHFFVDARDLDVPCVSDEMSGRRHDVELLDDADRHCADKDSNAVYRIYTSSNYLRLFSTISERASQ